MQLCKSPAVILLLFGIFAVCKCGDNDRKWDCSYLNKTRPVDVVLYPTNDNIPEQELGEMRRSTRVCLPPPCEHLKAYSGYITVDKEDLSYMFFLHIKSPNNYRKKPLLLWLQGGPAKSSLFGQFLENGPLGIDADGKLYYRNHTILNEMNIIYVDHPVGAGYSFDDRERYPSTLEEMTVHLMRFLRRFLRLFPEYHESHFYIAGESYGARVAVSVAHRVMTRYIYEVPLRFRGVMLGVGFLFPILDLLNSTDYLYYSRLLDERGRALFAQQFDMIDKVAREGNYSLAAKLLRDTVLNLRRQGEKSLYQKLTGFQHHGSIARPKIPKEFSSYYRYANSTEFKKIIHVNPSHILDISRHKVMMQLAQGEFFVHNQTSLIEVLNKLHVLFYTAQMDAVFPATNIERSFKSVKWRGSKQFVAAPRQVWHREGNASLDLLGYEKIAGSVMYVNVLFGGHHISFDRSLAISDLYKRFLKFVERGPPPIETTTPAASTTTMAC
ncbi:putative serine carboxypeptidase CPVL isoform X1 [Haemaphysalis longicornis]